MQLLVVSLAFIKSQDSGFRMRWKMGTGPTTVKVVVMYNEVSYNKCRRYLSGLISFVFIFALPFISFVVRFIFVQSFNRLSFS